MSIDVLLERHAGRWAAAERSPFLDGVRDGSLPVAAFNTWLGQDFLFVQDLHAFQRRLALRAPEAARPVLDGGVEALAAELGWFRDLADARGLDLGADRRPATRAYADLLRRLDAAPYALAVTALWALERVYLQAWRGAAPGAPAYRELVEHWTTPAFAEYVGALQGLVEQALDGVDVDDVLVEVLALERDFWDMASDSGGTPA